MGRARPRSAFIKPACGISPSTCKAISLMRIGEADKRNSNRDLRPRLNFHSKNGSQKPPRPPDSLPRLGATLQASASLLPDALTPLSPLGPAISGASPVGGMRDGENPVKNLLFPIAHMTRKPWGEAAFSSGEQHGANCCKYLFYPLRIFEVTDKVRCLFPQQVWVKGLWVCKTNEDSLPRDAPFINTFPSSDSFFEDVYVNRYSEVVQRRKRVWFHHARRRW